MRRDIHIVLILPVLFVLGCASAASSSGEGRSDPNVLTQAQIDRYSNVYQAVQTLRSQWFRVRSPPDFDSAGSVVVYRDNLRAGGLEALQRMPTVGVEEVRYFPPIAASQRWGLGHENGVIHVLSRTE